MWLPVSFLSITHLPGLSYSASLIYFASLSPLYSCSSSLLLGFGNSFLLHIPTSSFSPPRLILPRVARGILQENNSDHVLALRTLRVLSICSRMCFQDLQSWKIPRYSWSQPDSVASPPSANSQLLLYLQNVTFWQY